MGILANIVTITLLFFSAVFIMQESSNPPITMLATAVLIITAQYRMYKQTMEGRKK